MKEKVIVATVLCKHYEIDDVTVEAIKNLDFTVDKGEFLSIYPHFVVSNATCYLRASLCI